VGGVLDLLPPTSVVVADEAYGEYVEPSLRARRERDVDDGRPVIVMRTFSKIFGLAGLRLGYALAPEGLAPYLDVVQEPFNVNRAALAAGRATRVVPGLVEQRRREAAEARAALAGGMRAAGAEPLPSQANFLLVDVGVDDVALTEGLLRRGLLIRAGSEFGMPGFVRITVGPVPIMERVSAEPVGAGAEGLIGALGSSLRVGGRRQDPERFRGQVDTDRVPCLYGRAPSHFGMTAVTRSPRGSSPGASAAPAEDRVLDEPRQGAWLVAALRRDLHALGADHAPHSSRASTSPGGPGASARRRGGRSRCPRLDGFDRDQVETPRKSATNSRRPS
jgi:hypothetical protein